MAWVYVSIGWEVSIRSKVLSLRVGKSTICSRRVSTIILRDVFRVYLLDFFCSSIQFYLLLSPYLCFISLLYLDLYVLGDGALIS